MISSILDKINKSKRPRLTKFLRERDWSDTRAEIMAGNPTTPREDHGRIMIMMICHNLYDPSGEKWDAWCIYDEILQDGTEKNTKGVMDLPALLDMLPPK